MGWHQNHEKYLALPSYLDEIFHPVVAVLLSVTFILIFREIIPQAICSRYGLSVASNFVCLIGILMIICYPNAYPIRKTAKEGMTPIESRLCLDVDSKLDWEAIGKILARVRMCC